MGWVGLVAGWVVARHRWGRHALQSKWAQRGVGCGTPVPLSCTTQMARSPPPPLAQAYNKRATVLFLLQRFEEAIADCRIAMQMNVGVLVGCLAGSHCRHVHVLAPMLAPCLLTWPMEVPVSIKQNRSGSCAQTPLRRTTRRFPLPPTCLAPPASPHLTGPDRSPPLQPYHFKAAAGMGLCCAAVEDLEGSIAAYQVPVGLWQLPAVPITTALVLVVWVYVQPTWSPKG